MVYFFDGTKNGFLTAFCQAYPDEEGYLTSGELQLALGTTQKTVETDDCVAERAAARLSAYDKHFASDFDLLWRSGNPNKAQIAYRYFKQVAKRKRPVNRRLADPDVFTAVETIKKVTNEIHLFHGFVRFIETESDALYAPLSPDSDICDLLAPHFRARFPQFPFVLHDVRRKKAAVYDGRRIFVAPLQDAAVCISADEEAWQTLWKGYYHAVTVNERTTTAREKQMRGHMPVRYWDFLPEKHG